MKKIYGSLRLALALLMILLATLGVMITSFIPVKVRGVRLTAWSVYLVIHLLCFMFGIRVKCTDPDRMRQHAGLVFPNHVSVLDVLVLYYCIPVRFLAAHDVEDRFLIGWIARNVGTLFVRRDSPRSRLAAREKVVEVLAEGQVPPIVLFPEGRLGPGDTLFPFRHGAFGIAIQAQTPYMLCAIRYTPLDLVLWRAAAEGEGMWSSIWRMAQYTGGVDAEVVPLNVVHPCPDDSSKELANAARQDIAGALGLPLDESTVTSQR